MIDTSGKTNPSERCPRCTATRVPVSGVASSSEYTAALRSCGPTGSALASRDAAKAEAFRRQYGGRQPARQLSAGRSRCEGGCGSSGVPQVQSQIYAAGARAGKHVLVEKPAFATMNDYRAALAGVTRRNASSSSARTTTQALRCFVSSAMMRGAGTAPAKVFANFTTIAKRLKTAGRLAQR